MPLPRGYSREAISEKIRFLHRENAGRSHRRSSRQIVAIALSEARREAKRAGARPWWLRKRRSRHRRTR